jgi:3-methyladenine DNA glycosylase/8-oxoguanine DNA glycosylase
VSTRERASIAPPIRVSRPRGFDFVLTVESHGWFDLAPFRWSRESRTLEFAFAVPGGAAAVAARDFGGAIEVECVPRRHLARAAQLVTSMLRLDEDFGRFHEAIADHASLSWAAARGAGRLLRCPTAFEDAVKYLCTTNCSWALTRKMIDNLVRELGTAAPRGLRAFPGPAALAAQPVAFFRERVRCGYRSAYLRQFAVRVASGEIDPERWRGWPGDAASLRAHILELDGFGPYSAENLLKLCGRYDYLGIDSWCRATFARQRRLRRPPSDARLRRHYASFGEWRGLAMWLDLTREWHAPGAEPAWSGKG